jgi:hypothetical protein
MSVRLTSPQEAVFHVLFVQPALSPIGAVIAGAIQPGLGVPAALIQCPLSERWDITSASNVGGVVAGCGNSYVQFVVNTLPQVATFLMSQISNALTDRYKITISVFISPGDTLNINSVQIAAAVAGGIQDCDLRVMRRPS